MLAVGEPRRDDSRAPEHLVEAIGLHPQRKHHHLVPLRLTPQFDHVPNVNRSGKHHHIPVPDVTDLMQDRVPNVNRSGKHHHVA